MAPKIRSTKRKRDKENVPPAAPTQASATRSNEELYQLKRFIGNQGMQRRMQQGDKEAEGHPLQGQLGQGKPLDGSTRGRMESAFGTDFSQVRLHTDAQSAGMARSHDAYALSAGQDVVFGADNYQPGTLTGDTLLAHELAHTIQQGSATRTWSDKSGGNAEAEANRSALGVVSSLWQGVKDISSRVALTAGPAMRSGIQLQRCAQDTRFQPPAFLGPHSLATLETIRDRVEAAGMLEDLLVTGPLVVLFTSPPTGSYPLEEQAQAVAAVPVILRNRVNMDIDWLFIQHGNDLTAEERAYWNNIRAAFNQ